MTDPVVIEVAGRSGDTDATVRVEHERNDVVVRWVCGGTYRFRRDWLRQQIQWFEEYVEPRGDVWFGTGDDDSEDDHHVFIMVRDGRLYADQYARRDPQMSVPWPEFRAALLAEAEWE